MSGSDRAKDEHVVATIIDGVERTFEVADRANGVELAERILSAAEGRTTLRLVVEARRGDALVPIGEIVIDFARVTRTEVFVDVRAAAGGSVGLKR